MPERTVRHPWIDLLSPDGPFLSQAALTKETVGENWPPRIDTETRRSLQPDVAGPELPSWDDRRIQVQRLLTEVLGYEIGQTLDTDPDLQATHHIYRATVNADFVVHLRGDPSDPRLVVLAGPDASEDPAAIRPARSTQRDGWISTVTQRAALLARHAKADLALATNGEQHLLVNVATPTTGTALWSANALEDRQAQDAFVALLHRDRVLHPKYSTADLIRLAQERQETLTDTLGKQVRRASEALVNAMSRANRTTRGELLNGVPPSEVYSASTRVLMRIVFLLVAEERGLLPVAENSLYASEYAISTLLDELEEAEYRNRAVMQRHSSAWQRVMATTRAVHGGIDHPSLRLAAYGGSLFDPAEHPFLEGRPAGESRAEASDQLDVGVVDDFTMLTVLRHLQIADGQRLSYRTLDVEQIGHVYEALLDHSAIEVPVGQVVLGLVGKGTSEPEVPLTDLESWAAEGLKVLTTHLVELGVGSSAESLSSTLNAGLDPDSSVARTLTAACGNDQSILERVHRFAPLLRTDARGMALVFLPGDVYVTETSSKRDTGTAYTHRSLAEEVAKHALDPLIYEPGPQNEDDETKWKLRLPGELLDLKICDPAVGSAAILVAAARYLAEALIQSRVENGDLDQSMLETAASDQDALEIRVRARRDVVSNCVYGVDRDPMAVEMAKLSLWLITLAKDRPFTFLDHAIKCGDSLLGITDIRQLRYLHLQPERITGEAAMPIELGASEWWEEIDDSLQKIEKLRRELQRIPTKSLDDAQRKAHLHRQAEQESDALTAIADAIVAICLSTASESKSTTDALLAELGKSAKDLDSGKTLEHLRNETFKRAEAGNPHPDLPRHFLHWPLAFPEVFEEHGGFDAIVANPPFMSGHSISGNLGSDYRSYAVRYVAGGQTGSADLVAYFARRFGQIGRSAGFLATNTISQGQSLKVGLGAMVNELGWTIFRSVRMTPWPGSAGVNISKIWMRKGPWDASTSVDGESWEGVIAPTLQRGGSTLGQPRSLAANKDRSFQGFKILADGFLISEEEAQRLVERDSKSSEILRRYVNGETLHGPPPHYLIDRFVIDFGTMSIDQASRFGAAFDHVTRHVKAFVEEKAKKSPRSYGGWAKRWWQFERARQDLRKAIDPYERVLALTATSKVMFPLFVDAGWCLTHALIVFAYDDFWHFGVLSSAFHWWWAVNPPGTGGSSFKTDPRYTPTTSFQTFPQPLRIKDVELAASNLYEHREALLTEEGLGLKDIYGLVNDPDVSDPMVEGLRELHVRLDKQVQRAYAESDPHHPWGGLALDHDFYDCGSLGVRFTISEPNRAKMLDWLLELNYRRWAEENGTTFEQVMRDTGNA